MNDAIVNSIVKSLVSATGPELNAILQKTPSNVIAQSISKIIKNKITIPGNTAVAIVSKIPQKNLGPIISEIIKGAVGTNAAVAVVKSSSTNDISKTISNLIKSKIIISGNTASEIVQKIPDKNVVSEILKGSLGTDASIAVAKSAPTNVIAKSISDLIKSKIIISGNTASEIVKKIPDKNVVSEILKGSLGTNAAVNVAKTAPTNVIAQTISDLIKSKIHPNVKNALRQRNLLPNDKMIPSPTFNGPKPGYVFKTGNQGTGYYPNTGPQVPLGPATPVARNYSKMTLAQLIVALKYYPANKDKILEEIYKRFSEEISDIRKKGGSARARRLGELLRLLPMNFRNRGNATSLVIDDVRNVRNMRELSNLVSNLGRVPNDNIKKAILARKLNFMRKPGITNEGRRTNGGGKGWFNWGGRGGGAGGGTGGGGFNWGGRGGGTGGGGINWGGGRGEKFNFGGRGEGLNLGGGGQVNPGNWRRALIGKTSTPSGRPVTNTGDWRRALAGAPIPAEQKRAINYAGGVPRAMNQIARVPEGAPEVARTAEALHLTNGNARQAMNMHNVSAPAINAVRQLGGPARAVNVLEGLNTLSMKKPKSVKRRSKLKPRIAELNRVINAVKKKKLISLVAHNVTKTGNIHENENKLKKYYKKVIKADILRTPFAKIAKAAAKKRVM